jgi:hypothetical protein
MRPVRPDRPRPPWRTAPSRDHEPDGGGVSTRSTARPPTRCWEYRTVDVARSGDIEATLDRLGDDGWDSSRWPSARRT